MQRCGFDELRSCERAHLSVRYPPSSFG